MDFNNLPKLEAAPQGLSVNGSLGSREPECPSLVGFYPESIRKRNRVKERFGAGLPRLTKELLLGRRCFS